MPWTKVPGGRVWEGPITAEMEADFYRRNANLKGITSNQFRSRPSPPKKPNHRTTGTSD